MPLTPESFRASVQALIERARAERAPLPKLRAVLEALRQGALGDGSPEAVDGLRAELETFVDRELKQHAEWLGGKPALGGIFANARKTTTTYATKGKVDALRCPRCGAARPAGEAKNLCSYCGATLV